MKLIMIHIAKQWHTIDDSKIATFDKPSFYTARDSYYYLPPDSDILENIIDPIHKKGGRI